MQFEHAHGWRPQVVQALRAEMPGGSRPFTRRARKRMHPPGMPEMEALASRRTIVERVLREYAAHQEGLTWRTGHIDGIAVTDGIARGLVVDGGDADRRHHRRGHRARRHLGDQLRGPVEGGSCGFSYVSRVYRAREGQAPYDRFFPSFETGPGYVSLVMGHDAGTHSVVIAYPSNAEELATLRTNDGQDRACRIIPNLNPWTNPNRFEPFTDALIGGHLTNTYRLQGPASDSPRPPACTSSVIR